MLYEFSILIIVSLLPPSATISCGNTDSPVGYDYYRDCYTVVPDQLDWNSAEQYCRMNVSSSASSSGHLVSIDSAFVNTRIFGMLKTKTFSMIAIKSISIIDYITLFDTSNATDIWIGASTTYSNGDYTWTDGITTFNYTNWAPGSITLYYNC